MTSKILHHEWLEDSEYINPDNVARDVFGDWNNQESVLKAANYCNEWRERCLAERKSHIFETVMSVTGPGGHTLGSPAGAFAGILGNLTHNLGHALVGSAIGTIRSLF